MGSSRSNDAAYAFQDDCEEEGSKWVKRGCDAGIYKKYEYSDETCTNRTGTAVETLDQARCVPEEYDSDGNAVGWKKRYCSATKLVEPWVTGYFTITIQLFSDAACKNNVSAVGRDTVKIGCQAETSWDGSKWVNTSISRERTSSQLVEKHYGQTKTCTGTFESRAYTCSSCNELGGGSFLFAECGPLSSSSGTVSSNNTDPVSSSSGAKSSAPASGGSAATPSSAVASDAVSSMPSYAVLGTLSTAAVALLSA